MSDCDSASVGSAGSAATVKRDCPVCHKEFTTRSLFNHIRNKHDAHWFESMWSNEKMLNAYIDKCEPVPFSYTEKNDFDEDECKDIYGCLACNNTFTQKARGITHCNKKKCKANHIKEIKALIQRVIDMKKRMMNRIDYSKWSREKFCTAIETEMRWYKWIKQSHLWRTLYDYYAPEREARMKNKDYDKSRYEFTWAHNTPDGLMPFIPDIEEIPLEYNKDSKDLLIYLHHWAAINGSIHGRFRFMRWHYEMQADGEMFFDNSENHPEGQYTSPGAAEFNLHKLPTL